MCCNKFHKNLFHFLMIIAKRQILSQWTVLGFHTTQKIYSTGSDLIFFSTKWQKKYKTFTQSAQHKFLTYLTVISPIILRKQIPSKDLVYIRRISFPFKMPTTEEPIESNWLAAHIKRQNKASDWSREDQRRPMCIGVCLVV